MKHRKAVAIGVLVGPLQRQFRRIFAESKLNPHRGFYLGAN
jgi:hypothetical protein